MKVIRPQQEQIDAAVSYYQSIIYEKYPCISKHKRIKHFVDTMIVNKIINTIGFIKHPHSKLSKPLYNGDLETFFFAPEQRSEVIYPKLIPIYQSTFNLNKGWKNHLFKKKAYSTFEKWLGIFNYEKKRIILPKKVNIPTLKAFALAYNFWLHTNNNNFGYAFENVFIAFLNMDYQEFINNQQHLSQKAIKRFNCWFKVQKEIQIILNKATKSSKNSSCMLWKPTFPEYKTDCYYRNKNRSITRMSLKTIKKVKKSHNESNMGRTLITQFNVLFGEYNFNTIQAHYSDIINFFLKGINKENIQWLLYYQYDINQLDIIHYKQLIDDLNQDITICPVSNNRFNIVKKGQMIGFFNIHNTMIQLSLKLNHHLISKSKQIQTFM